MQVIIERDSDAHEGCTVQVGIGTWNGGELSIRNVWPDRNGDPFYRGGQIPLATAAQGIELAAERGLLDPDAIKGHVDALVAALARRAAAAPAAEQVALTAG